MPRVLVKTLDMPREEWLSYRRKGIGGSDAATICGLNPYSSLIALYADKMGLLPDKDDTEAMRIGRDLEEYVAKRFCEATGKKVKRRNAIFQHEVYDFITANIDREVVGENAGLECKTTSVFNKNDFENGEISLNYLCQCRHYMNVMGYDRMYLAVLVLGKGFYWYTIEYDKEEGEALLGLEVDFWQNYIEKNICPEPDGSESAAEALKHIYKDTEPTDEVMISNDDVAAQYMRISAEIKILEREKEVARQALIKELAGAQAGFSVNYNISNKSTSRSSVDSKSLKARYPKVYNDVLKTTSATRFIVSERKE